MKCLENKVRLDQLDEILNNSHNNSYASGSVSLYTTVQKFQNIPMFLGKCAQCDLCLKLNHRSNK